MLIHETLTSNIINCFYNVYNELGPGFLEKVYENAMMIELNRKEISCIQQAPINVFYHQTLVGTYYADILVENAIILELKTGEGIIQLKHEAQLYNYLKATEYEVGLILFFGEKANFKRKIFTNDQKRRRI